MACLWGLWWVKFLRGSGKIADLPSVGEEMGLKLSSNGGQTTIEERSIGLQTTR